MAYIKLEDANVTTLDEAQETDVDVVAINLYGDDVLAIKDSTTGKYGAEDVGKVYEVRGELIFALTPEYLRRSNAPMRAHWASDSALRAIGWNI